MATPETNMTQQVHSHFVPLSGLGQSEFFHVVSGPRISSAKANPKKYYGPVTIRNYLAGHAKKSLRLSRAKDVLESGVFLKLPVELQLQVLEHLHPLDLYHVSLVSKFLRKVILHPKALGVWKAAFLQHPDLPPPPSGVKESDWAFMIYGPGICGLCGQYGALTDFSFLMRLCACCRKNHCLGTSGFRDESYNAISPHHDIWTLIPKSYRFNGIRYSTYVAETFFRKDFSPMWKKLTLIRILAANGVPLVSQLYEEYKIALQGYVQRRHDSATKANSWAVHIYNRVSSEYDALASKVLEKCKVRLQGLGHDQRDIRSISNSLRGIFREEDIYRLTRKTFREIRPRLEAVIRVAKDKRIRTERQNLLKGIYRDYLKARPPDEWQYVPQVNAPCVLEIQAFEEFLGPPFDTRGDMVPGYAASFFSDFINKWVRAQQERIVGIFPALENGDETFEAKVQRLELATSVVTCRDCNDASHSGHTLLGWKSICRHLRSSNGRLANCQKYELNQHLVAAATSLISCVGLDPSTATGDDMDRRDDRFMCGNCMPEYHRGCRIMRVYTWMECLAHTMEMVNMYADTIETTHARPAWLLLSPAATRFVREHEKPHPHPLHCIWRCNHCAHHFEQQTSQADVVAHVTNVHCIKNPVIGVDIVADQRLKIPRRRPFRLIRDPAIEHRCKRCPNLPIYKLWEKDALMEHLIKKHHIIELTENVDWETPVMIAASSASVSTSNVETDAQHV